jgi:hypothetical protein
MRELKIQIAVLQNRGVYGMSNYIVSNLRIKDLTFP